jgi:ribonuclease Z
MKQLFTLIKNNKFYAIGLSIVTIIIIVFGAVTFVYNLPDPVIKYFLENQVAENRNKDIFNKDGIYVITTGTGAPLPDKNRSGPQTVVYAGGQLLVFDAGPGTTNKLESSRLNVSEIDAFFFTHYHSDHIGDFGELMLKHWAVAGSSEPLQAYGPTGINQVVDGFESAYQLDKSYRIAHHGDEVMPPSGFGANANEFNIGTELADSGVVYEKDGVKVTAFNTEHPPVVPNVGYKVEYKGRSVAISGDTIFVESLIDHVSGVDLFVSEMLNHKFSGWISDATKGNETNASDVTEDIQESHINGPEVGRVAREAGVKRLLITHVLPPVPHDILKNPHLRDLKSEYNGPVDLANDGTMIFLPPGSDKMEKTELLK